MINKMGNSSPYDLYQDRRLRLIIDFVIAFIAILCVCLIYLAITGYSTVKLSLPNNVTVRINGHDVTNQLLKMRPGNYQIVVSSPIITPDQETLHVSLFRTTIYKPILEQRSINAIASSTIGAAGPSGAPDPTFVRWFDNNTWVVGLVAPSTYLALHYNNQSQWVVGYYNNPGYPENLSTLPVSVATYIEQLEARHAGAG
jgi:hypothetical protein